MRCVHSRSNSGATQNFADEASRIELGLPYDMYANPMALAICHGGLRDQILA